MRSSASSSRRRGSASRPSSTRRRSTLLAREATSFQQSIGAAASFDPVLVEAVAESIRRRMQAIGASVALAPVFDITRDPRWGRVEETYGEDPYLAAVLGCAYVRGLQGTTSSTASPRPPSTSSGMAGRGRVQPGARARRAA